MNDKVRYFLDSLYKNISRNGFSCPSCGANNAESISRKYVVTSLRRCATCSLLFRTPTTSAEESDIYYQNDYQSGLTTDLPDRDTLAAYMSKNFIGTPKNFSRYIKILYALGCRKGDRILDFGCSWGYGTWQLKQSGFDAIGYELSAKRAEFARRKLGLAVIDEIAEVEGPLDIFFSAHVLEHLPSVRMAIELGSSLLREGGLFVSITPNGSLEYRKKKPQAWNRSWGLKHPNLLDEVFYSKAFEGRPYLVTSDLEADNVLISWSQTKQAKIGELDGWELLAVFQNLGKNFQQK